MLKEYIKNAKGGSTFLAKILCVVIVMLMLGVYFAQVNFNLNKTPVIKNYIRDELERELTNP